MALPDLLPECAGCRRAWNTHRLLVTHLQERLRQHEENLRGWQEPDGSLIPTEPDPGEREHVRMALYGGIYELRHLMQTLVSESWIRSER